MASYGEGFGIVFLEALCLCCVAKVSALEFVRQQESGGRGLDKLVRMRDTTLCLDIRRRLPLAECRVCSRSMFWSTSIAGQMSQVV
jgi:hypothetical protein